MNTTTISGEYDFYFTNVAGNIPDNISDTVIELALSIEFIEL